MARQMNKTHCENRSDDHKWKSGHVTQRERSSLEKEYKNKMTEELELGSHLRYTSNKDVPFLDIYRFEEAFSFELIWKLLDRLEATADDYVFDPFCGSGTTLFASMIRGIPSLGVDTLPVAWFVSKTLPTVLFLKEGEITKIWKELSPTIESCIPASIVQDVPVMKVAFENPVLVTLRKMKTAIDDLPTPYRDVFLFLFFSILEECSLMSKENRYLNLNPNKKGSDPINAMNRRIHAVETGVAAKKFSGARENVPEVFLDDTRNLSRTFQRKPTILMTSPPYVDKIDYTRSYALELCFHFVKTLEEFERLKKNLLRSYAESHVLEGEDLPHPAVEEVVTALKKKTDNSCISTMVAAYFIDMKKAIKEWYHVLSRNARVAIVVDDVRYEGEIVPVDLILSDMAAEAGFAAEKIIIAKYKGMNRPDKVPLRESILMWRK